MAVEFHTQIRFPSGEVRVILDSDFFCNSLTKDPYPHSHPKYELHYILQGTCILMLDDAHINCPEGHFLLLPPHCIHRLVPMHESVQTASFLFSAIAGYDGVPPIVSGCSYPSLIADIFDGKERLMKIRKYLTEKGAAYCEKIQGEMTCLLAELCAAFGNGTYEQKPDPEENRAEHISAYLAMHRFDADCSCDALAKEMNLSTRQVHRLCVRYFNATFRDLLLKMRMETAAHRLRTTDVSVTQLASELGYSATASFSAAYKRYFGVAPTKERI